MYDVAIIGGGIIGSLIGRELSRYDLKTVLLEKDNDVANGTTKANSALVHAGYDATPGSLKAKFNALGNQLFDKVCHELDVPFKRIGSLVLAFSEAEMKTIHQLYERGLLNGIPEMEIITGEEVRKMEPNLSPKVVGALHAKTGGIVGPWELAIAAIENAMDNGLELRLNTEVNKIEQKPNHAGYIISTTTGCYESKVVINCAGLFADKINNMVAAPTFEIHPRRGEYNIMDKGVGNFVSKVVFQCPNQEGKGVVIAPTVHGNLLVGPNAEEVEHRDELETTTEGLGYIREKALKSAEKLPFNTVITAFAGLRATPDSGDFIIGEASDAPGFINAAGIESPGLTAAPAVGEYVAKLAVETLIRLTGGEYALKQSFEPIRRPMVHFFELPAAEKAAWIAKDPRYGTMVCRCENITEGEIVDAIRRNNGGITVDGIKRRVRPGTGRCQGGFCGPRVMEILAREHHMPITAVVKDGPESFLLTHPTKEEQTGAEAFDMYVLAE